MNRRGSVEALPEIATFVTILRLRAVLFHFPVKLASHPFLTTGWSSGTSSRRILQTRIVDAVVGVVDDDPVLDGGALERDA